MSCSIHINLFNFYFYVVDIPFSKFMFSFWTAVSRVSQKAVRDGRRRGGSEILLKGGGIFFTKWWEPGEEWFWPFEPFAKLKIGFCEYWTSNKIEISMTCASKEYQIKTKLVQEQWLQLKMKFLLGNNFKVVI